MDIRTANTVEALTALTARMAPSEPLVYVTDRYGRDMSTYRDVEEFLAMCEAVFGERPVLRLRRDGWHDVHGLVLAAASAS